MKRVILTGATGAIGNALIRALIADGTEVLVLAREGSARNATLPQSPLVTIRYCDLKGLADLMPIEGDAPYDVFYHFAWDGTTGQARNDMYLQNQNVRYALDAVCAAHRFGCHTFIGAGSQAEYGRVEGMLRPDTPTYPEMGYGIGKLCAGMMTREACHAIGMRHVWVRILSIYGPYDGKQSMVMSTVQKLLDGVTPSFTKGEQKWDYLYSADAARAFVMVGEKGRDGRVYVLGSGVARPLCEYIGEIRDVVAPEAALGLGEVPYAPRQVMHLQADISALREDTGWEPEYAFAEGMRELLSQWK